MSKQSQPVQVYELEVTAVKNNDLAYMNCVFISEIDWTTIGFQNEINYLQFSDGYVYVVRYWFMTHMMIS